MQTAFEKIRAVPGVLGAFIAGRGELRASSLPAFFSPDMLDQAGDPLLEAFDEAGALSVTIEGATLTFGDTRVVVSPLPEAALLFVICQETADLDEMQTVLETIPAGALSPTGADHGAGDAPEDVPEPSALEAFASGLPFVPPPPLERYPQPPSSPSIMLPSISTPEEASGFASSPHPTGTLPGGAAATAGSSPLPAPASGGSGSPVSGTAPAPVMATPVSAAAPVPAAASRAGIPLELRNKLQVELARYVGPVASLLVAEVVRSGVAPAVALERLAGEIDAGEDREAFREALSPLLR